MNLSLIVESPDDSHLFTYSHSFTSVLIIQQPLRKALAECVEAVRGVMFKACNMTWD